jgi:tripartite-type tricarboxylate transporter receptor subunit TctC
MQRRQFHRGILAAAGASVLGLGRSECAHADGYPVPGKPIGIIVPYAPGGGVDTSARLMAAGLEPLLHTSVQAINRPGAASQVGMTELVRSRPDGYTLAYAVLPTVVTHYLDPARAAIYTRKSFQPIGTHHMAPMMLAVPANSPYRTLKDMVEAARKAPGAIKISDSGLLGTPHVCALMLQLAAGVKFASVHFPGGAPSVTAVLGGHVDVLAGATSDARAHKMAGTLRVLGVAAEQPDPSMPDVPTMRSQGFDVITASIPGLVAPAGTPQDMVATLTAAMRTVIESPEHRKRLLEYGVTPHYLDPAAFEQLWADTEIRMKPLLAQMKSM